MVMAENLLTLWPDAIPADQIPAYPFAELLRAQGGETTFYISERLKVSEARTKIIIGERPAEPGELIRDSTLKYIPDWQANLAYRMERLDQAERDPAYQALESAICKSSILYFANVYCWSFDPRLTVGQRTTPFVSFPLQDDVLTWLVWLVRYGRSAVEEKSRDMGASWMAVIVACWLAVFYVDMEALFMSMREEDVDDRTEDSLLGKVRKLLNNLPEWMRAGWVEEGSGDKLMQIKFPQTRSVIKGILSRGTAGRSGRATVCFNDEFAFVEDSLTVLTALSELANTKIYLSTPNGTGNEFHRMATEAGALKKRLHYADHPLKTPEWKAFKQGESDMTEEIWSKEQEIQYETSMEGRVFSQFLSFPEEEAPWLHVQEGTYVEYDSAYDVYDVSDLGVSDPCSTLWAQIKPPPNHIAPYGAKVCLVFFEEHELRNMTAYDLRWLLNSKRFRYRDHIVDLRTGGQRDSSGRTWIKNLADPNAKPRFSKAFKQMIHPGPPIHAQGKRSAEDKTIEKARTLFNTPGAVVVSKQGCPHLIESIQNWSFPIDKETRKPKADSSPEHSQWSHAGKAMLYLMDWLFDAEGELVKTESTNDWNFPAYSLRTR